MEDCESRLVDIEVALSEVLKIIEDMNGEIIRQSKIISRLEKENKMLIQTLKESPVKPLSEETPPPHY